MPSQTRRSSGESVRVRSTSSRSSCAATTSASTGSPGPCFAPTPKPRTSRRRPGSGPMRTSISSPGARRFARGSAGSPCTSRGPVRGEAAARRAWSPTRSVEDRTVTRKSPAADPEKAAFEREVRSLVEAAVEGLPEIYRTVFMLRHVEELSTAETAELLELTEETVKTRLHRARTRAPPRAPRTRRCGSRAGVPLSRGALRSDGRIGPRPHRGPRPGRPPRSLAELGGRRLFFLDSVR